MPEQFENEINENNEIVEEKETQHIEDNIDNNTQTTTKKNTPLDELQYTKRKRGVVNEICRTIVFVILIMIVVRVFLIDSYTVPSESMYSTLIPGDRLFAFKSVYGIRLPIINYTIPCIFKPKKGDIIIFEHPEYKKIGIEWEILDLITLGITRLANTEYNVKTGVKRCIGEPGDTVFVDSNRDVYINGKKLEKTFVKKSTYNRNGFITEVNISEEKNGDKTYQIQEENNSYSSATPKFYIPKKDDVLIIEKANVGDLIDYTPDKYTYKINGIELDRDVVYKYESILSDEIGIKLSKLTADYYEHKFKHNYYFGMGDNRDNSRDSRSWGLIRDDLIFGTPSLIFFPFNRFGLVK